MKKQFLILIAVLIAFTAFTADPIKVQPINMSATAKAQYKSALDILTKTEAATTYTKVADLQDPTPLIYSTMSVIPTTSVTDNYTLILTDAGKFISMTAAADKTITIPLFATVAYPVNTVIYFENLGTADLIIAITATGTLTSESSWVKIPAKGCAFIRKSATNTWNLAGRLKA